MANTQEPALTVLSEQNLQSQLEPLQIEIYDLISKLKGMSWEEIQQEINSSFALAKKRHDEAILEEKNARERRLAIDLEALGSDAGSAEDSQSADEDLRAKVEEKWTAKLIERMEKLSAAKFLALCNEKRATVTSIWGCSSEMRKVLDRIIDGEAEEHSLSSDAASSVIAFTDQSGSTQSGEKPCPEITTLQQELNSANWEIDVLKAKIMQLESQRTVQQARDIEGLNAQMKALENDKLKARTEKEEAQQKLKEKTDELASAEFAITALKKELKMKDPLFKVGVRVRCAFFQSVKRVWYYGEYVIVRRPLNLKAIWDKNEAAHRGNYEADKSLFDLGTLTTIADKNDFQHVYAIPGNYELSVCPKVLQLVNCRGSLMACGYLTEYTHDKATDERAEKYFNECKAVWEPIFSSGNIDMEKKKAFEANLLLDQKSQSLKKITEDTIKKEQKRLHE